MPPVSRKRKLRDITSTLKSVRLALARAEAQQAHKYFMSLKANLEEVIKRIHELNMDTTDAYESSYTGNIGARKAFRTAAAEMDMAEAELEECLQIMDTSVTNGEFAYTTAEKFFPKLLATELRLGRVVFGPPMPRTKPTIDELADNERMENSVSDPTTNPPDSNLNKYKFAKLDDETRKALGDILK